MRLKNINLIIVLCLFFIGCNPIKYTKVNPTANLKEVGVDIFKNVSTSTIKGIELAIAELYGIKVGTI